MPLAHDFHTSQLSVYFQLAQLITRDEYFFKKAHVSPGRAAENFTDQARYDTLY